MGNHQGGTATRLEEKLLGYPSKEAIEKTTALVRTLIKESGESINGKLDTEDIIPYNGVNLEKDVYSFASAAMLAQALLQIDGLPTVKLDKRTSNYFEKISTSDTYPRLFESDAYQGDGYSLIKGAAEQLIEGIETQNHLINVWFDPFRQHAEPSKHHERFLRRSVEKMRRYARHLSSIADLLEEFDLYAQAGYARTVSGLFKDRDVVLEKYRIGQVYLIEEGLLKAHANLFNLPYNAQTWPFAGLSGEDIAMTMKIASEAHSGLNIASELRRKEDNGNYLVSSGQHNVMISGFNKEENLKESDAAIAAGFIIKNLIGNKQLFQEVSEPFFYLDHKMHQLGLPLTLGKEVMEELEDSFMTRTRITTATTYKEKELHQHIADNTSERYIRAVNQLVNAVTGAKERPVSYLFMDGSQNAEWVTGISPWGVVAEQESSHIKHITDFVIRQDEHLIQATARKLYPHQDIYLKTNYGACFVLGIDELAAIINPKTSVIDVRDAYSDIPDKRDAALARLQVDAHELVHTAQTGTPVINRAAATYVMRMLAENAYMLKERSLSGARNLNLFDAPNPYLTMYNSIRIRLGKPLQGGTIQDLFKEVLAFYCVPLIAKNKRANYAEEGFFKAIWRKGRPPIVDGELNYKELHKTALEDGLTMTYYHKTRRLLTSGTPEELKKHIATLRNHEEDLLIVAEHMAEAFSLTALYKHLDAAYKNPVEREELKRRITEKVIRRGEQARRYHTIMADQTTSWQQKEAALAREGMRYEQYITHDEEMTKLIYQLGYDALDVEGAFKDPEELKRRALGANNFIKYTTEPYNSAKALIGLRYSTRIPLFLDVIAQYGSRQAFKKLTEAESIKDVEALLKKR